MIRTYRTEWLIALVGTILFLPFLGNVHLFDWDEINFAECAREMIATGDYTTVQINYQPFWEKPPLFIWMQVLSMKIFGINEFAARFPNAVCGIITLLVLYRAGKKIFNEKFGIWWVILYAGSLLPHLYFKSGIIDPWFNLFIFLGFYYFYLGYYALQQKENHGKLFLIAGLFLGLAVMTKGPVAILVSGMSFFIFFLLKTGKNVITIKGLLLLITGTVFTGSLWFILLYFTGHGEIIMQFINYQIRLFSIEDAGHGGPFYYHFAVLFFGCFPASVPAIAAHFKKDEIKPQSDFKLWMLILFWVTLILFSIVKTKIVHYSSLCYFPLTFLGAWTLYHISVKTTLSWKKWMSVLVAIVGLVLGIALAVIPIAMKYKTEWMSKVKDPFAYGNLQAEIHWTGFESLIGIFLITCVIIALVKINKQLIQSGIHILLFAVVLTLFSSGIVIVNKIEGYSQNAAIEFYESIEDEEFYICTMGYKSYAYLFYSKVPAYTTNKNPDEIWMAREKIDKPAYFVCKIKDKQLFLEYYPLLEVLYEKNGFVFFRRGITT